MTLKQTIQENITKALREKDEVRLSTLRMLASVIANKEIALRKKDVGLSDEEVIEVVRSEVKKRKDSIEEFKKGGRDDLADKEAKELEILNAYAPPEMPDEELRMRVEEGIREANAKGAADFGMVMKIIMPILKGKASGDRISTIVREALRAKDEESS